jgi:hypothetical protein
MRPIGDRQITEAALRDQRRIARWDMNVAVIIGRAQVNVVEESPTSGDTRIQGALKPLGHQVGRSTIRPYLAGPAVGTEVPDIMAQVSTGALGPIAAVDFFTRRCGRAEV